MKTKAWLISIRMGNADLHGFVTNKDDAVAERAAEAVMIEAEKIAAIQKIRLLPVFLMTGPLTPKTTKKIYDFIRDNNKDARLEEKMSDNLFTAWLLHNQDPFSQYLMQEVH